MFRRQRYFNNVILIMLLQWNPDFSNLTKKCLEKSGAQLPNIGVQ